MNQYEAFALFKTLGLEDKKVYEIIHICLDEAKTTLLSFEQLVMQKKEIICKYGEI